MTNSKDLPSGRLYLDWGPTEEIVKQLLTGFNADRRLQVTLASVVAATRFQFPEGGIPLPTTCYLSGEVDSSAQLLTHCPGDALSDDPDARMASLVSLATLAYVVNPHI